MAATAIAQERPTLDIEPKNGTPGTIIELSGEGYSKEFSEITVEWEFENDPVQPMEASVEIENETLFGQAVIPEDASAGTGTVIVCHPNSDDVVPRSCAAEQFSVTPLITVTPDSGTPGTAFELASTSFRRDNPSQWEVRWSDGTVVGSAVVDTEGISAGSGTVPRDAAEGTAPIEVCGIQTGDDDVGVPCYPVSPPFEVRHPDVTANPTELSPGEPFEVTGEEWCCSDERGEVFDADTEEVWGEVFVDSNSIRRGIEKPGRRVLTVESHCFALWRTAGRSSGTPSVSIGSASDGTVEQGRWCDAGEGPHAT